MDITAGKYKRKVKELKRIERNLENFGEKIGKRW